MKEMFTDGRPRLGTQIVEGEVKLQNQLNFFLMDWTRTENAGEEIAFVVVAVASPQFVVVINQTGCFSASILTLFKLRVFIPTSTPTFHIFTYCSIRFSFDWRFSHQWNRRIWPGASEESKNKETSVSCCLFLSVFSHCLVCVFQNIFPDFIFFCFQCCLVGR